MNLDHLNKAQREAVLATEGAVSVLAGAGSGKTRVLTHRVAHLIGKGVPASSILAITFTNKAAKEMKERVETLLTKEGFSGGSPFVSTFHALGVYILRAYGNRMGLKRQFTIYDRADSIRAIKGILEDMGVDTKELEPRSILSRIGKEKGEGKTVKDFTSKFHESFALQTTANVWEKYEALLRKEQALDFDDLISKPLMLIKEHADVREALQNTWRYVHIDEFQDTNTSQGELVHILTKNHGNIFVVGDVDQCIYTWRQAKVENLLDFEKVYPKATKIVLSENYRSTKTIVESANKVIEKNVRRHDKVATTSNPEGEPITLAIARDERGEAKYVVEKIAEHQDKGVSPNDMAVLYRTNFQSRALEEAFLNSGIPYQVLGTKFFERKEVKDALSYLRLALNSESVADLTRIMNVPARGIGKVTLLKVVEGQEVTGTSAVKVQNFFLLMERIRTHLKTHTVSDTIRFIIEESGLATQFEERNEEDKERLENLKELASLTVKFDHLAGEEGALALIEEATLLGEQDTIENEGGVKLMTVHAAKGLEFTVVCITGLEEGLFPHERDEEEDTEEERRLFYVALTRAKEKLYITFAQTRRIYGTLLSTIPSSFIHDLDQSRVVIEEADEAPSLFFD